MKKGFTIVELLIVIVVIAILAVITIVAFNGVQSRARVSSLTGSLNQAKKKLDLYKVDNSSYPLSDNQASAGLTNGNGTNYQYTSDGSTYCITASSASVSYQATQSTVPTSGSCSGHASGGILTNLIINPSVESNTASLNNPNGSTITREANANAVSGSNVARVVTPGTVAAEGLQTSSPLTAGDFGAYNGSIYLWGSGQVQVWIRFGFTDTTFVESSRVTAGPLAASPVRYNVPFSLTDNGKTPSYIHLHVRTATAVSTNFFADGLMITKGTAVNTYADGNSPGWSWSGATNNSSSTGPAL